MNGIGLSVVIASHNSRTSLEMCLRALVPQATPSTEIIVCDCSTDATADTVRAKFPTVSVMHFDEPLSLARLRSHGIAASRGEIIAILDAFSIPAADWAAQVTGAHARLSSEVIGGAVDLHGAGRASFSAWITYLNEYGLFMSPVRAGATWILPGSNLSYKRPALFEGGTPRHQVFWKTFANWEREASGQPLYLEPAIQVELHKPIAYADFLRTRFVHGRCFAGMRVAGAPLIVKVLRAGSTVLVPFLQLWRWTSAFWPKRRYRLRFAATLPAQFLLFVVWSAGEAVGYIGGTGGACERTYY